jgi:hypothetical protein
MSLNRTSSRVAIGLWAVLLAWPTFGSGPEGMQLFAPADVSTWGGEIPPNDGYFFQFDGMFWTICPPKVTPIGAPGQTRLVSYGPHPITPQDPLSDQVPETNTLTSGDLPGNFSIGQRYEFGHIEDRNGWFVSIYQLRNQGSYFVYPQADVVFIDPVFGQGQRYLEGPIPINPPGSVGGPYVLRNLPVVLYDVLINNQISTWGVEANYLHRTRTLHNGGTFEFFGGARYYEFNDGFGVYAGNDPGTGTVPSFLSNSSWYTTAGNHVIGPQIGMRWFKKQGRWMLNTEGRFTAGLNVQNLHQDVTLGPNLDPGGVDITDTSQYYRPAWMGPKSLTHNVTEYEFTPLVELRLEGRYQITRYLSFHAGWTGIWMDNIARANAIISYTLPNMGIDTAGNKQNVFINGVTIGLDFNR